MGYVSVMGYVSHIFMYMDIRNHINLIKNHGYEGKIGMIKKDVHGIVMLAAKAGEDEHAAYIAGFAGGCAYDFLYSNSTE